MKSLADTLKRLVSLPRRNQIRLALKRHPIEFREMWPEIGAMGLKPGDVVLDVGANVGDFTLCTLAFQPWAAVHAFEPLPGPFWQLQKRCRGYSRVKCNSIALGGNSGMQRINVSAFDQASSFLAHGAVLDLGVYGIDFTVTEALEVSVEMLDRYVARSGVRDVKLLKLDVQGYELEVLKGGESTLPNVEWVYVEAQFQELYKNGPMFDETFEFLNARGFDLLRMVSFRADDVGKLMECDMVFRRR